jgi:hypothetical protein
VATWAGSGPLEPEACRRLACDGAVTWVVVTRQPDQPATGRQADGHRHPTHGLTAPMPRLAQDPCCDRQENDTLAGWLRAAMTRLPPLLGGARSQPLDVGRTSRVITPTQRQALAVRDGGCGFPGCARPLVWCEGHHLVHWLDGGPTDLANLVLVCRAHHRAVHEGGWRLARGPDGGVTATPPHRRHPSARRQPSVA